MTAAALASLWAVRYIGHRLLQELHDKPSLGMLGAWGGLLLTGVFAVAAYSTWAVAGLCGLFSRWRPRSQ